MRQTSNIVSSSFFFINISNVIKCFFIKGTKLINLPTLQGLHFTKLQFSTLGNTDLLYLKKRPPNNNFILRSKINLSCLHLSFSILLMDYANQFQEEVKILHFLNFYSNNEGLWFRVFKWPCALFKMVKLSIE